MDESSRGKKLIFSAILFLIVLVFAELIASEALLLRMRRSDYENFSLREFSYSSALNIVGVIGFKVGIFPDNRLQLRQTFEPGMSRVLLNF